MSRYRWALTGLAALALGAVVLTVLARTTPPSAATGRGNAALIPTDQRMNAAEFTGLDGWLNSQPLTVNGLRSKVVLVDFWTFSCVNCVRTIPHLQHLQQTYAGRGLVIVGMHSPEFDFEKQRANVAAAVQRFGVTWPVALDSAMSTWNAYGNQYWPAEYLIDQSGRVAYMHFGEGEYDVTESAIAALLGINSSPTPVAATPDVSSQTPELYAGSVRGQLADGESYGATGQPTTYPDPGPPRDADKILVTGRWADQGEYLVAASPGYVRLSFSARDVYLVAGQNGQTAHVTVTVDGAAIPASQRGPDLTASGLDVTGQQLYHLLQNQGGNRRVIDLTVPDGFRLYTFTFG
ncbi:MAG: redoxin family protein [Candidatus Dormibacteraeota bacterium]|uniref:Redoxin family protein n=1 Tax=Candidatus Aeolococcus gillhamiae TaxID=3127015 RepID=A0A934K1R9_9BACT|nr:redoxin family protein [Candidatus Dormibacteraeota bacterium]